VQYHWPWAECVPEGSKEGLWRRQSVSIHTEKKEGCVKSVIGEGGRFLTAGLINTVIGFSLFPIVDTVGRTIGIHYFVSLVACNVVNWLIAYLLAAYWVFPGAPKTVKSYLLHNGLYWFLFVLSLIVIPFFAEVYGVDPRWTYMAFAAFSVIAGFAWQKFYVFRLSKDNDGA
jgi:putative flippase GtrA